MYCPVKVGFGYTDDKNTRFVRLINKSRKDNLSWSFFIEWTVYMVWFSSPDAVFHVHFGQI